MNTRHAGLAFASLGLLHCTAPSLGNRTSPSPGGDQSTSLSVTLSLPSDATDHTASVVVGQPVVVDVFVEELGPGTCSDGFLGKSCSQHTVTPITSFDLADVGCDDDRCEVTSVTHDAGRASALITLVPKASSITLHASATSGALSGAGDLWLVPADHSGG